VLTEDYGFSLGGQNMLMARLICVANAAGIFLHLPGVTQTLATDVACEPRHACLQVVIKASAGVRGEA
jgi:hypothetical protein